MLDTTSARRCGVVLRTISSGTNPTFYTAPNQVITFFATYENISGTVLTGYAEYIYNGVTTVLGSGSLPAGAITTPQIDVTVSKEDIERGYITLILRIVPTSCGQPVITTFRVPYSPRAPPAQAAVAEDQPTIVVQRSLWSPSE